MRVAPVTWQIAAILSPFVFAAYIGLLDAADASRGLNHSVTQAQAPIAIAIATGNKTAYLRRSERALKASDDVTASLPVNSAIALMLAASGSAAVWNARAFRPRRANIIDVK